MIKITFGVLKKLFFSFFFFFEENVSFVNVFELYSVCVSKFCCLCYPGGTQAVCPLKRVEADVGGNVRLPCHTAPRINLSASTLDWKRPDLPRKDPRYIVHAYRNQQDLPQLNGYAHRTSVNHSGLQRGDLSLLISSVGPSDSGTYESYIVDSDCGCRVQLNVGELNHTTVSFVLCCERPVSYTRRSPGVKFLFVFLSTVHRDTEVLSTASPSTRASDQIRAGKQSPGSRSSPSVAVDSSAGDLRIVSSSRCCQTFTRCIGAHHPCSDFFVVAVVVLSSS